MAPTLQPPAVRLQASPDFKGIKTAPVEKLRIARRFKPALISKGLRPSCPPFHRRWGFKPALISKGLRRIYHNRNFPTIRLQASPDFKGIKTQPHHQPHGAVLQASPDFKGIKTARQAQLPQQVVLQASPDFKGIKTVLQCGNWDYLSFKPALISKGLRLLTMFNEFYNMLQASPDFKGIKTFLDVGFTIVKRLQASPDFKGIKTNSPIG